ncbi:MAG: MASE3 domain-containing protein, partial [Promethearchaeota archaeon]
MLSKEEKKEFSRRTKYRSSIIVFLLILFLTYLTQFYSYLLFHTIAELFSVVIAFGIFVIGWNTRKNIESSIFLVLGVSLLYIGSIDLIHTLAYKGMGIFVGYDANLPTQLWIAARYLQAGSFLMAFLLMHKKINPNHLIIGYTIVTTLLVLLIFGKLFPDCYIEGIGLTPFKIISEYIIIGILTVSIIILYKNRKILNLTTFHLKLLSILSIIIAEIAFTFYVGVYDLSNLIGHIFKIISFYLIYLAIVQKGLEDPLNTLLTRLKQSEETLKESEEKFRLTFENASDAIIWADTETGNIINCNHTAELLLEREKEEIIGMHQTKIHPPEKSEFYKNLFRKHLYSEEIHSDDAEILTKSGKIVPVTITASTIKISEQPLIQGIFHNISERKKAEQRLKNLISTVSHELRTPITVLMMSLDLHKQKNDSITPELENSIIETEERNVLLLKDLSEDLLIVSQIDEKKLKLDLSEYNPLKLLEGILVFLEPFSQEKRLSFRLNIEENINLRGDIKRIDQIFRIILDNAIKYSYENTVIEISALNNYQGEYNFNGIDGVLFQINNY